MNLLLDAALAYAARGIPVYPVHWPRPTPDATTLVCSCPRGPGCDRPAKHPLVRHGIHEATTNPGQLQRWWHRWPTANLGLATGIVFDALDIDGPAGLAALQQLAQTLDLRLPGPVVHTRGGGWHSWFRPTGWATAHPAAWRAWTGAAAAAPCWSHPAGTSRVAPTGGCATWTRHRCPRSRPPCAPCSTPAPE
jgi:hypothetical protein